MKLSLDLLILPVIVKFLLSDFIALDTLIFHPPKLQKLKIENISKYMITSETKLQFNNEQETLVHAPKLWAEEISKRALLFP